MADLSTGAIVAICSSISGLMVSAAPLYRSLTQKRLAQKKATIEELTLRQDASEAAYVRLERENSRQGTEIDELYTEVTSLRKELGEEQRSHDVTKRALQRVTADCAQCREVLAKVARRRDVQDIDHPTERREEP